MLELPVPQVQASHVDFALHTLGWKAFQDLAIAVSAEVLARPVQYFLPSKDGGRDGAFVGAWSDGSASPDAEKSTIQCKFVGKAGATITVSSLKSEIAKIESLAARGLAHDYIVLTNAGVSADVEAEIVATCQNAGAKKARVLGRDWLTLEIKNRPRLRMMVPRLYGLGDLSQIIDQRAYVQATHILSAMREELAAFVTTDAHRQSVKAMQDHRFVLLLGDPASGKSTIGASLAVGALDNGAIGAVRLSSGEAFEKHWNPHEPTQFFWIDDAFGETQYQRARVDGWNTQLRALRAAVKAGARVIMTSRNYIWNSAKRDLKLSEFPLLTNSQVIIDVQGLSDIERAQILYNHVRLGDQDREFRRRLKPFLAPAATNPRFLPETARRLGDKRLSSGLSLTTPDIAKFVEHPVDFLKDVLRSLSDAERGAVALIFLSGERGVSSPIDDTDALDTVCRLTGSSSAEIRRALEDLRGSLTILLESAGGRKWMFKHPTIADAYGELIAESPELVEVYVRGAKPQQLFSEVVCGNTEFQGAKVHVPASLYGVILDRMGPDPFNNDDILRFASYRCDVSLLGQLVDRYPDLEDLPKKISSDMTWSSELTFLVRLHENGLLPESVRRQTVRKVSELALDWADPAPFANSDVRSIFNESEFTGLVQDYRLEIIDIYGKDPGAWDRRLVSGDRPRHLRDLQEGVSAFAAIQPDDGELAAIARKAEAAIEERISEIEETEQSDDAVSEAPIAPKLTAADQLSSIFDDVDE